MNIPDELRKITKPGEKAIAFDPESGVVHSTDFAPLKKLRSEGEAAISDILDSATDKDVYFVISAAIGRPGILVESDCLFRGSMVHLRVIHHALPAPRTFVLVSTKPS